VTGKISSKIQTHSYKVSSSNLDKDVQHPKVIIISWVCWVTRGAWETVHVNARTTTQVRATPLSYDNRFMSTLTCKMFNLHFSIQCVTYKSHLHTTLLLKCESMNSYACLKKQSKFMGITFISCYNYTFTVIRVIIFVQPMCDNFCDNHFLSSCWSKPI
jgi:hypothetical protein